MVNGPAHRRDNKVWVVIARAITMKDMVRKVATRDMARAMVRVSKDMVSKARDHKVDMAVITSKVVMVRKVMVVHRAAGKVARVDTVIRALDNKAIGTRASKVVMVVATMATNPAIGVIVASRLMAADNHPMDKDHKEVSAAAIWAAAIWVDMEAVVRMIIMDKVVAAVHSMVAAATMATRARWVVNTVTRVIADKAMVVTRDMVANHATRVMVSKGRVMDNKV